MRNWVSIIAVVLGVVAVPAGAKAPPVAPDGAYITAAGAETQLAFISSCASSAAASMCGDGVDQPGPYIKATHGRLVVRFDRPATQVEATLGQKTRLPTTRIDDTHWSFDITQPLDAPARVHVDARGGSAATSDTWDAAYVATLGPAADAPTLRPTVTGASKQGRRVLVRLGGAAPYGTTYVAFVQLHGRRVSQLVRGEFLLVPGAVEVRLHRDASRSGWLRGRFVLRVTAGGVTRTLRVRLTR